MTNAEIKCRKLCTGSRHWSPTYKNINLELDYWRMRQRYLLDIHRNVRQLIVLQNQIKITYDSTLTINSVVNNIIKCYAKMDKDKGTEDSLIIEYRNQLAAAKEAAGEIKPAVYIRNLNKIDR